MPFAKEAKALIQSYYQSLDTASPECISEVMKQFCEQDFKWHGCHPFNTLDSTNAVCEQFWKPLRFALTSMQRRQDILMAGKNHYSEDNSVWVVSMGHLMGLHDNPWLNIPPTRKMAFLRYCEFHQVRDDKICESTMFFDIPKLMVQAGVNPFPPCTGAEFIQPGPMTHEGVMEDEQDVIDSKKTLDLIGNMIDGLSNGWIGDKKLPLEEELALTWHDDMIWWGPTGIGSAYTIERYAKQHAGPFRKAFTDWSYIQDKCRFAEGNFGGILGWPCLSLTHTGGFMGMPSNDKSCEQRIVDIYRRDGDKLAENWVFIDWLHYYNQQGLDILDRLESLGSL